MVEYSIVVAGLPTLFFDRLRKEAETKIAPSGKLFLSPNPWVHGYSPKHVDNLISQLFEYYVTRPEKDAMVTLLLYADYADESTERLLARFFPFALPRRLPLPDLSAARSKQEHNRLLNEFTAGVVDASRRLRAASSRVSHKTHVHNLNPLLLPVRNFQSNELSKLLWKIYSEVSYSDDPEKLINEEIARFLAKHPWATPPDGQKRALSDGVLYFKSPGNDRHGFMRNGVAKTHPVDCLLNARSRLGGRYDYCFHYDCTPVKGKLKAAYPNCHGHERPPKERHVNIAPNDFII